ncbi:DsbA family protein [Sphingomonas parva]|uniref:DsbA family protein n=1 Tax=Sphingomonas parva TaxID=2555898 RepID=A0A4Y8ZNI7_9SPHN|nr:DsbA family protein [Sphingomonas parva]TFI57017.1 DsbA family protein [Sphingomonas parva]
MASVEPARPGGVKTGLAAGVLGIVIGGAAMALWVQGRGGTASDEQVGETVRAYLLEHPEVIPEAMQRLQEREAGKIVSANRAAYETPFAGAWAGAQDADVVLVEFFDYACGYCRKSNADVDRLLAEDKKLKVVWREWPVLGPDSERAAQVSLAAAKEGRFRDYFHRLYALGRPSESTINQAAAAAGVSPQRIAEMAGSAEAKNELGKNFQLAQALNASGTPTFIVGDRVLHGAVGYDELKKAVGEARES